jgi:hypothetical protein
LELNLIKVKEFDVISFIIIMTLGLIVFIPFSKDVRKFFAIALKFLFVYIMGWVVFAILFGSLWCWSDPNCTF